MLSRVGSCAIVPRERGGDGGSYRAFDPLLSFYYTEGRIPNSAAKSTLSWNCGPVSREGRPHGSSVILGPGWTVPVGFREKYLMSDLG